MFNNETYRYSEYNVGYLSHLVKKVLTTIIILCSLSSYAQIAYVEGIITSDRTWVKDTTYVIFKDVTVAPEVKLTIEPGTVVKINYNRQLIIDDGILKAIGTESDSIKFLANHSNPGQFWKWSGIVFQNMSGENENHLNYVQIEEAETAILIEESSNIIIQNSSMRYCQNMGLHIYNSKFCFIVNCVIEENYNGIQLYAGYLGTTSDNLILNCKLRNENHNVYIIRESGGIYQNNTMSSNLIADGNNGIWIDNFGGSVNSENVISKNIIINNGSEVGYGLFLAHDSTIVTNNIFWNNNIAIFSEDKGNNCSILNNSFYDNRWAIAVGAGSEGNKIYNNTFSLNEVELFGIKEVTETRFKNNNLVNNDGSTNIIVNNTPDDIAMPKNYWGTVLNSEIDKLIFDQNDDPALGKVNYEPVTTVIDTTNPMSAPYKPIKQLVNNVVQVSWNKNEEPDLRAYNVYYGDFIDYKFDHYEEAIADTTHILTGDISVFDLIAVTAIDSTSKGANTQVVGHESPFAFAELYPYAGNDSVICKFQQEITMTGSNIPFEYQSLYWSTSGDGIFSDEYVLQPTYYPGEDDELQGDVILSMNVITELDTITDSFHLYIIEDPFAFAGNDTIIIADTILKITEAEAHNYNNVSWITHGDGYFENDTLVNTIYFPGEGDNETGEVILELQAHSSCGTAVDSLRIIIEPYFSVEGRLWTNNKSPYQGIIIALMEGSEGARASLLQETLPEGEFRFPKVMKGDYYIYAVPDTNNNENLAPGYYANKMRWQSAYLLPVDADVYDIDIYLPELDYKLPDGEGTISGFMTNVSSSFKVDEIYCMPWFEYNENAYCRGGISNNTILLYNNTKTKLLNFTLTDAEGSFYFNNLPYGEYIVDAEKAGFTTTASPIISLSPEHKNETDVILEVSQLKIGVVLKQEHNTIDVYPVPSFNNLYLPIEFSSDIEIMVFDIFGNRILHLTEGDITPDNDHLIIDISELKTGIYFGQVGSSGEYSKFRFIVR